MMQKFDFKKEYKELYMPKGIPSIIEVPEMLFIKVEGKGDPNTSKDYQNAIELLYGLSYSIKMSKMKGNQPDGYFDFVVPPLEGFWWIDDVNYKGGPITDKDKFCWTSVIRQPEFVTEEVFEAEKISLQKKKPELDLSSAKLFHLTEGLCVQIMHTGSYDEEPETIERMEQHAIDLGYTIDINDNRKHHEIYMNDARKTPKDKLKTIIRHPIV
jgi:hypothetical protein